MDCYLTANGYAGWTLWYSYAVISIVQIPCPVHDDVGVMAAVGVPLTSDSSSSPLLETTCVIVPPISFQHHDETQPSFISALELVSQAGFEIRGLHMVLFSEQRARALCCCFSGEYKVIDDHGGSSWFKN